jgi:hypothetical protein
MEADFGKRAVLRIQRGLEIYLGLRVGSVVRRLEESVNG